MAAPLKVRRGIGPAGPATRWPRAPSQSNAVRYYVNPPTQQMALGGVTNLLPTHLAATKALCLRQRSRTVVRQHTSYQLEFLVTDTFAPPDVDRSSRPQESAPVWVRNEILKWIEQGKYKPADSLPSERELQELFGVSRVVIREALVRLQAVGLVKVEQGRGCYVTATMPDLIQGPFRVWIELNASEVLSLLKVRRSLDGLAAAEAAESASEKSITAVVSAEHAFAEAVQSGEDPVRLASLDKRLHVGIATASGLTVVSNLLMELDHHSANIHRTSLAMEGRAEVSVVEHRAIVQAIQIHDPDRARQAAESHVSSSIEQVRAILAPKLK